MESRNGRESNHGYSYGESRSYSYGESRKTYSSESRHLSTSSNTSSSSRITKLKEELKNIRNEIVAEQAYQEQQRQEEERLQREINQARSELENLRKRR